VRTINNCTISGNSANGYGGGGGIFNGDSAATVGGGISSDAITDTYNTTLTISNSTISDNSAPSGGGIADGFLNGSGGFTIGNTIVTGGIFVGDYSLPTSLGYNLSDGDGGGVGTGPGDQIYTAPMLGPLQDNGGLTFTRALLCGSPAVDAGNPSFSPPPRL
jgi:hypothetical protein